MPLSRTRTTGTNQTSCIIAILIKSEPEVMRAGDITQMLFICGEIASPNGKLKMEIALMMHWAPVDPPPVEPPVVDPPSVEPPPIDNGGVIAIDSNDELAGVGKLTKASALPPARADPPILPIKKPTYVTPIRKARPQRPFTTMLDRGNFSIDVMLSILPEIPTKALAFDMHCRRRNIMDGDVRLRGAEPYSFNEAMADYFAYAEWMIREGSSRYVLLTGGPGEVKKWWEASFCPVDKRSIGCQVQIGKRWVKHLHPSHFSSFIDPSQVRVWYIDHPEYLMKWCRVSRLRETLKGFSSASGMRLVAQRLGDRIESLNEGNSVLSQYHEPNFAAVPKPAIEAATSMLSDIHTSVQSGTAPGKAAMEAFNKTSEGRYWRDGCRARRSDMFMNTEEGRAMLKKMEDGRRQFYASEEGRKHMEN